MYRDILFVLISDINDSEAETHNCRSEAVSNSTKGSFNCTCKPGYKGDGYNCTGTVWGGLVFWQRIIQKRFVALSLFLLLFIFFLAGFSFFISCEACGSLLFLNTCRLLKKIPIVSVFTFGEMAVTALVKEKGSWREALNSTFNA